MCIRDSYSPLSNEILAAAGYRALRGTASVDPETGENSFKFHDGGRHFFVVKTQPDEWYLSLIHISSLSKT